MLIPIYWKYLIKDYLKVLLFCTISFVAALLTMRLDEITEFAAQGSGLTFVAKFTLYQIPYILPIALALSSLISSVILFQRLSKTHELTAFRSLGISIREIIAPILITSFVIALFNLFLVSEVATQARLSSKELIEELKAVNPLVLLQNKALLKKRGLYSQFLEEQKSDTQVQKVLVGSKNKRSNRISLILANEMNIDGSNLQADTVTFLTPLPNSDPNIKDSFLIENSESIQMPNNGLAALAGKKGFRVSDDHLSTKLLLAQYNSYSNKLNRLSATNNPNEYHRVWRKKNQTITEAIRRIGQTIVICTFTLLGIAFGFHIGRNQSNKGLFIVVVLASMYLTTFFLAKSFDDNVPVSATLYLAPHILMILAGSLSLRKVSRGVE